MQTKWPDGTPKSSGNAFDWRTEKAIAVADRPVTKKEMIEKAMRENLNGTLGSHAQPKRRASK